MGALGKQVPSRLALEGALGEIVQAYEGKKKVTTFSGKLTFIVCINALDERMVENQATWFVKPNHPKFSWCCIRDLKITHVG